MAETPPALDERVQNLAFRADTVLEGAAPAAGGAAESIDWDALAACATANFEATGVWFV